jgi:hypothetical protein
MNGRLTRWAIAAPFVVLAGLAATGFSQVSLDAKRQVAFDEELLYLPNEKLLTHFNGGMSSVVADMLWLQCIQYTSKQFKGDGKFTWLNHMLENITRLDPHFLDAYHYGSIFLASLEADDGASLELLEKGMVQNPDRWELPYDASMVYLLNRREEAGAPEHAARYLGMAVATGTAPESVLAVAEGLKRKHDLTEYERAMWEDLAGSNDAFTRELGERKLIELDLRINCREMTKAVGMYAERHGSAPTVIEDLVAGGILVGVPADPLGGRYFLDDAGEVQNTSILDGLHEKRVKTLVAAIGKYQTDHGNYPESLETLEAAGVLHKVPRHPYSDRRWVYDPASGTVS